MAVIKHVNKTIYLFVIFSILIIPSFSLAVGEQGVYALDTIIVDKGNDTIITLPLSTYKKALRYQDNYYDFLINDKGFINVIGVGSGGKCIKLRDYKELLRYGSSVSDAIKDSPTIDATQSSTYKNIDNFDFILSEINIGLILGEIEKDTIYIVIPNDQLDKSINYVNMSFSQPVKIDTLNSNLLEDPFIRKLESSGYQQDKYYSQYSLSLGSSWKYLHIIDATNSLVGEQLTFVNEYGMKKTYNIYFKIK